MKLKINSLAGSKKRDAFGYAVAIGDLNGDGISEVIIASTNSNRGATIIIFSSKTFKRLKTIYVGKKKVSSIRLVVADINNDNINELIIGITYQDLTGEVRVYSLKSNKSILSWKSSQKYDAFGFSIASGDVNGDGTPDVIVSAPQPIENGRGKVYAYSGKDGSLLKEFTSIVPREHSDFGTSVAAFDFDGDGIDEIIIGAPGRPRGEVFVYSGVYGWLVYKLTSEDPGFGYLVHGDDINGDNIAELMVTTKNLAGNTVSVFQNGQHLIDIPNDDVDIGFGETLATGDINGDGIKELIIGAFDSHHRRKKYTGQVNIYNGVNGDLLHRWYGKAEKDQFGFSLATGKLYNKSINSVIIGTPREILGKRGMVYIATLNE